MFFEFNLTFGQVEFYAVEIKEAILAQECKRRSKNPSLKRPVGPIAPE